MRLLLIALLVGAVGCAPRMRRHVYVPKSSGKCWRECKLISETCDERGRRHVDCEDERLDCLLTCPGAYEAAPVPAD